MDGGSEHAEMERKLVSLSDGQHFMRSIPVPRDDYGLGYVTRGILVGRGVITMLDAYATASVFGGKNDDQSCNCGSIFLRANQRGPSVLVCRGRTLS